MTDDTCNDGCHCPSTPPLWIRLGIAFQVKKALTYLRYQRLFHKPSHLITASEAVEIAKEKLGLYDTDLPSLVTIRRSARLGKLKAQKETYGWLFDEVEFFEWLAEWRRKWKVVRDSEGIEVELRRQAVVA